MSDSVNGDPEIDKQGAKLADENCKVDHAFCKNLDLEIAKRLRASMLKGIAELDSAIITKVEQSIGGHIGGTKSQSSRIKKLEGEMRNVIKAWRGDSHG